MGKLIVAVGLFILTAVLIVTNLPIKYVSCQTQFGNCPDYLQSKMPNLAGKKWIDKVDPEVLQNGFGNLPQIERVTIQKKYPMNVTILITLRKVIGVVYSTANQTQVAADDTGILFAISGSDILPKLVIDRELEIGSKLNSQELAALNILYKATLVKQNNLTGKIIDSKLEIKDASGQLLIVSLIDFTVDWQYSLQAILARSKIDGKVPHKIDLRFEDPVVVY